MASTLAWRTASSGKGAEGDCQGFLFKLKENGKEWKKLYVVLYGNEIVYYDSPHDARANKRQKDGTKQVTTAYNYDEFSGPNAPTTSPAYLMIETTHAKKVYCAKTPWRFMRISKSSMVTPRPEGSISSIICCSSGSFSQSAPASPI